MAVAAEPALYTKDRPFSARVCANRLLSGPGSTKETRHFVVPLAGSGMSYASGDSLGVFPTNDPTLVDEVLGLLGCDGTEKVVLPRTAEPLPLREALFSAVSLAQPSRKTIELMAARAADAAEQARLTQLLASENAAGLTEFLSQREFVDLLAEFPSARPTPQEFVDQLRRLVPRLYSIASSPVIYPHEVHLTVAIVRYETNGRRRGGVCSTFLADRVTPGVTPVPVFVASSHFRLPEDDTVDVIMVGPGTGIAPFRAFLQERAARGAFGRNWLFFGDQRRACDFLYGDEFEAMLAQGRLHRLDTAFSRDQPHKIYVQDRMRENGPELWSWLQRGAAFYVCGDARRMAKDVDAALHEVVAEHGRMSSDDATAYVRELKRQKRYQRDVY